MAHSVYVLALSFCPPKNRLWPCCILLLVAPAAAPLSRWCLDLGGGGLYLCPEHQVAGHEPGTFLRACALHNSLSKPRQYNFRANLQGIFLTQEWSLGLPHCRQILYCLSYQGSLMIGQEKEKKIFFFLQLEEGNLHVGLVPGILCGCIGLGLGNARILCILIFSWYSLSLPTHKFML